MLRGTIILRTSRGRQQALSNHSNIPKFQSFIQRTESPAPRLLVAR